MNIFYAKTILYSYGVLEDIMEQIDELVEKKALSSMTDVSDAYSQCQKILDYTAQKDVLINIKIKVDKIFSKFSPEELIYLDYKYFKKNPKSLYSGYDFTCRTYFRKQIKLASIFASKLEKVGITDEYFEKNCLCVDFFKELLKRVKEKEKLSRKNKPVAEKLALKLQQDRLSLYA